MDAAALRDGAWNATDGFAMAHEKVTEASGGLPGDAWYPEYPGVDDEGAARVTSTEVEVAIEAAKGARKGRAVAVVVAVLAIVAAIFAAQMIMAALRPDPFIGTWGYSTMGIVDEDAGGLSETQLARFSDAKSFAALVMQGFYITANEDGTATVEAFGRKIGATWERTSDTDYVVVLATSGQDSDQRVALSSIDVNSERMEAKMREDGRIEIVSDSTPTATGYRTYSVFEKVDPSEKVENALFDSADQLKESVLAQSMSTKVEQDSEEVEEDSSPDAAEKSDSAKSGDSGSSSKAEEKKSEKKSNTSADSKGSSGSAGSANAAEADPAQDAEGAADAGQEGDGGAEEGDGEE